jgi:hypothetical protein
MCSKCHVQCLFPKNPPVWFINNHNPLSKLVDQGFYYCFPNCDWDTSLAINNLSCQELIIRDIIQ